jgi:hypothetical protein
MGNQLVKVKYYSETTNTQSDREYTYFSADTLKVGDKIIVPVKDTTGKAIVSSIDIPESEIEKFKDKVKIIPAGSLIKDEEQNRETSAMTEANVLIPLGTQAIIIIDPEKNVKVTALLSEITKLRDYAKLRIITSDAELTPLTNDLTLIAKVKKAVTELKEVYVRPIKNHLDSVSVVFNNVLDVVKEADTVNRNKFTAYKASQEKRVREIESLNFQAQELARKQAELNHGEFTVDTTPITVPVPVQKVSTESGGAGTIKVPKHEVIDFKALPDDYMMVDAAKLQKVIKAANGNITIAGVKIWYEDSVIVNTK